MVVRRWAGVAGAALPEGRLGVVSASLEGTDVRGVAAAGVRPLVCEGKCGRRRVHTECRPL